jgi:hypothetical protein
MGWACMGMVNRGNEFPRRQVLAAEKNADKDSRFCSASHFLNVTLPYSSPIRMCLQSPFSSFGVVNAKST